MAAQTYFLLISRKIWLKSCGRVCILVCFFDSRLWRELLVSLNYSFYYSPEVNRQVFMPWWSGNRSTTRQTSLMKHFPCIKRAFQPMVSLRINIAKGTTDPRVEFISQILHTHHTQILVKFQFQNLDLALTSKSQPNISIWTKHKLKNLDQT